MRKLTAKDYYNILTAMIWIDDKKTHRGTVADIIYDNNVELDVLTEKMANYIDLDNPNGGECNPDKSDYLNA